MICPFCKKIIKDDAKFCGQCGRSVPRCPTCGRVITKKTNFCTEDGTKLPENIIQLFQTEYEERTETVFDKPVKNVKKKRLSRIITIVLLAGLSVISITAASFYFYNKLPLELILPEKSKQYKNEEKIKNEIDEEVTETVWNVNGTELSEDTEEMTEYQTVSEAEEPFQENELEYFITHCDAEYFDMDDLKTFDKEMCRLARNGIYARCGRKFNDITLQEYFEQYDWYEPEIEPDEFTESLLNEYQIANRDLIVEYEKELSEE
jgi:RNA polymerase subunit RPABC4/transcription elongation factor Spt4